MTTKLVATVVFPEPPLIPPERTITGVLPELVWRRKHTEVISNFYRPDVAATSEWHRCGIVASRAAPRTQSERRSATLRRQPVAEERRWQQSDRRGQRQGRGHRRVKAPGDIYP